MKIMIIMMVIICSGIFDCDEYRVYSNASIEVRRAYIKQDNNNNKLPNNKHLTYIPIHRGPARLTKE